MLLSFADKTKNTEPRARFSKTLRFGVEPVEWLENLIDDLEGDGFLESNVLLVRQKLYVRLLSHIQRGESVLILSSLSTKQTKKNQTKLKYFIMSNA